MKMQSVLTSLIVFALVGVLVFVVPCRADKTPTPPVDDQLLKSLGIDSLDQIDRERFAPEHEKGEGRDTSGRRPGVPAGDPEDWKRELLRELGDAAVAEEENPLLDIARQMRHAERLIAQSESGDPTQQVQREIVARLDELIQRARASCKAASPSQSSPKVAARQQVQQPKKKPGEGPAKPAQKPVSDPNALPGKAEATTLTKDQMRELIKSVWGELPETEREQMLQWAGDAFLPKYQLLIELYFKRLVEKGRE